MSHSKDKADSSHAPRGLVVAAFAAVYLIWGSTYLGIKIAVETLPPFLMGGARFVVAGGLLFVWMRMQGMATPSLAHWKNALIIGALLLGVGNGGVNWAEQRGVASGMAALLIAMTPLWFALLDWLRPGGVRPARQTMLGILTGFAGMLLLVSARESPDRLAIDIPCGLALLVASVSWSGGSLYARYTPKPAHPLMGVALQMIMGGGVLLLMGVIAGEPFQTDWTRVSRRSLLAYGYLTLVGSLVGFTAYSWLLKASTPARVSTYAYVNPVIAVLLGWLVAGETLTNQMIGAAAVIVVGVIILTTRRGSVSVPGKDSLAKSALRTSTTRKDHD